MNSTSAIRKIRAFNRFYTNLIGVVDRHILDSPYSLTEVRILYELYHQPGKTARSIRDFLRVDEGYLSRTIDKLKKQGLIQKTQSRGDGREFHLSLTDKGKLEFSKLNVVQNKEVATLIEHLSQTELEKLVTMIADIEGLLTRKVE